MKWCFHIGEYFFFREFWWRLAQQIAKEGDECVFLVDCKIAEYGIKPEFLKQGMKFISKVDWCIEHYDQSKKDFGDLSWKEFFPDFVRYKPRAFNYENSVEVVSQLYQFLDFVFQNEKPDVFLSSCPADLFEQVAYYFHKKYEVPWPALLESQLGESITDIYDLEDTNSQFQPTFEKLQENDISEDEKKFAENFLDKFISHKQAPYYTDRDQYIHNSVFILFEHYIQRLKSLNKKKNIYLRYLWARKHFKKYDYKSDLIFQRFIATPFSDIRRQLRIFFQKHFFGFYDKDDSFFLFPLHFQPEYTTSVLATYYSDQLATISNIAFALPFPYKLYVKEHPASQGTRPNEFYNKLEQIPNVVLIHAKEKIEKLIKNSAGVITLSGTAGLEATLSGKPAYVLGKTFYTYHPLCRKIDNFDELKEMLQADIIHKPVVSNLKSINLRFIVSYLRNSIAGSIFRGAGDRDTNDYGAIYRDLKKKMEALKK